MGLPVRKRPRVRVPGSAKAGKRSAARSHPAVVRRPVTPRGRTSSSAAAAQLRSRSVDGRVIYEWSFGAKRLTSRSHSGELLDRLLDVLDARPPYLHPKDRARYAVLLPKLKAFEVTEGSDEKERSLPVKDLPLERLRWALELWIGSALRAGEGSLIPTFVLDAARFVETHAWGRTFFPNVGDEIWEIAPLLAGRQKGWPGTLGSDSVLKKRVTAGLRDLIVRFTMPRGSRLIDARAQKTLAGPSKGWAAVHRCHLSASFSGDWVSLNAVEDPPMRHDVDEELKLLVSLRSAEAVAESACQPCSTSVWEEDRWRLELPGRWITAALVWPPAEAGRAADARPRWESCVATNRRV
jgi:hypothetical protein